MTKTRLGPLARRRLDAARWEEAFRLFAKGDILRPDPAGELYVALLRHAGHSVVDEELVRECLPEKMRMLNREFAFHFLKTYEDKALRALEVVFLGKAHFGFVQLRHLQDMIKQMGYMLSLGDFQELLEEAQVTLRNGALDFQSVTAVMDHLADREGFTEAQLQRFLGAFERFDVNGTGLLEEEELPAVRAWLSFCAQDADGNIREAQYITSRYAQQTMELIPEESDCQPPDLQPALQGCLGLREFLQMLRRHMNQEYIRSGQRFKKLDNDKDGFLDLVELRQLFQQLGHSLSPEALLEAFRVNVERLEEAIHNERLSFSDFRVVLEHLRDSRGFSQDYLGEALASFSYFDGKREGTISSRRAQRALEYHGYHLGMSVFSSKSEWKEQLERMEVSAQEFLSLCRSQEERELQILRTVFRKYAEKAALLRRDALATALKMVNTRYESFYPAWLKRQANLGKELDFEDFRRVEAEFRRMSRDAFRELSCFKDTKTLEEKFKKLGLDTNGRLPSSKLAELFDTLYPALKWDPSLKQTMRSCMQQKVSSKALGFSDFLAVLRRFEDASEELLDQNAPLVSKKLELPPGKVDEFLDAFHTCRCRGPLAVRSLASVTLRKVLRLGRYGKPEELTHQKLSWMDLSIGK
ncbi:unnamed protein product [Effrenium voratum]|nr:unnamed protein product [Effrenium voratum]